MKSEIAALVLIASTAAWPVRAQDQGSPPVRLTLDQALARGMEASHRLGDLTARHEAADAVAASRHSALLPQVGAQAGYSRTNHVTAFGLTLPNGQTVVVYPDIPDNYRSRLDLQWPIYTGGRLDALERAARDEASASESDLAAARADLRLEITRAYWALVTSIESVRVVDESLARMDAHLKEVRDRFDAGLVPPNDVSSVEAQRSRQRMLTIQARALRDNAQADLARLTGVAQGAPIEPAAVLEAPAAKAQPAAALVEAALTQRAERAAFARRLRAADDRLAAATAGLKPTVTVGGGVNYARPNPLFFPRTDAWHESWDASVNINWPVFDGGRTKADVAEATANRRAIGERLADFDATLSSDVRQRLNDLTASSAVIAAATDAVTAAADARRVVADRYQAGVATNTEVIDAQVALLQAELDRTQAIANARLAEARLARALGQ
jgi:outer membrane protein